MLFAHSDGSSGISCVRGRCVSLYALPVGSAASLREGEKAEKYGSTWVLLPGGVAGADFEAPGGVLVGVIADCVAAGSRYRTAICTGALQRKRADRRPIGDGDAGAVEGCPVSKTDGDGVGGRCRGEDCGYSTLPSLFMLSRRQRAHTLGRGRRGAGRLCGGHGRGLVARCAIAGVGHDTNLSRIETWASRRGRAVLTYWRSKGKLRG